MKRILFSILFFLFLITSVHAGQLLGGPKFQAFDGNGDPLSGGLLCSYIAGTNTAKVTYSDKDCTTPNANPTVLNSRGEATVYLCGSYKLVLRDNDATTCANGTQIWEIDNIESSGWGGQQYFYPDASATDQGVTGDSNTMKYAVDTAGEDLSIIYLRRPDTPGSGETTAYTLDTSLTIPDNITLIAEPGVLISGTGTLTIDGSFQAGNYQVFDFTSITVVFGKNVKESNVMWGTGEPNGTANNSVGFQGIVTASAGIETIIPKTASNYRIKNISIPSESTLRGYGLPVLELVNSAATGEHMLENSDPTGGNVNINIIGLTLDGNESNQTNEVTVLYFDNVEGFNVSDNYAYDMLGSTDIGGLHFVTCENGYIEHNKVAGLSQAIACEAIFVDNCENISIERNRVYNFDLSGIASTARTGACRDIRIVNNYLDEAASGASAISLNSTDSIAANNIIKGVTQIVSRSGIVVGHTDHPGDRSRVIGNVIDDCPIGITVYNATDVGVIGNFIQDCSIGIRVNTTDSNRTQVVGNNITTSTDNATIGSPLDGYGIRIEGDDTGNPVLDVVVSGNNIYDTENNGIKVQWGHGIAITGNTLRSCGASGASGAVNLEGLRNSIFSNNIITDIRGTPALVGVTIDYSENTDDILIKNNIISGPTTPYSSTAGGTLTGASFMGNFIDKTVRSGYVHKYWYGNTSPAVGEMSSWSIGDAKRNTEAGTGEPLFWVYTADGSSSLTNWFGVGYVGGEAFTTLGDNATPSVKGKHTFLTGGTTKITDFDDGIAGQRIVVLSKHNITFDTTTAQDADHNLDGSSADIVTTTGDITKWLCEDGTTWHLEQFIDASADNS